MGEEAFAREKEIRGEREGEAKLRRNEEEVRRNERFEQPGKP